MNQQRLVQLFARANEFKEGDLLVGGTRDARERDDARQQLSALRLGEITHATLVEDSLSLALARSLNAPLADEIAHLTIRDLKRTLLGANASDWAALSRRAFKRSHRGGRENHDR